MAGNSRINIEGLDAPRTLMLILSFILVCTGIIMVYSAAMGNSFDEGSMDSTANLLKQIAFAGVGVISGVAIYYVGTPAFLRNFAVRLTLVTIMYVLIVATAVMGLSALGAQRWIEIGPVTIQPTEFVKIIAVIVTCAIWADYQDNHNFFSFIAQLFFFIVLPIGLIFVWQSDLGSTMIIAVGVLAVLWIGGADLKWLIGIVVIVAVIGVASILFTSYRANRMYFTDPWSDGQNGLGNGLQLARSIYAFAKGGLFGVGPGASSEKLIMPESETDFIYAIIGEEFGFIGTCAIAVIFFIMLICGLLIAHRTDNLFSMTMAGGLTVMLVFQAFLNMGCVTGLLPTTGKPLPFLSSGGSSMFASIWMISLILSTTRPGKSSSVYDKRRENLRIVRSSSPRPRPRRSGAMRTQGRKSRPVFR